MYVITEIESAFSMDIQLTLAMLFSCLPTSCHSANCFSAAFSGVIKHPSFMRVHLRVKYTVIQDTPPHYHTHVSSSDDSGDKICFHKSFLFNLPQPEIPLIF